MSRDVAAEMRDFSQDEPTHRGMAQFWASEVEAMQRRIAELEDDVRASRYMHEEARLVAVKHWGQIESDRAVIEAARAWATLWDDVEPALARSIGMPQVLALLNAIRLHDETQP